MVKKCLLILLMLLCMSACTSKEEKQELDREKQQGTANCKRNLSGIWRCITHSQAQTETGRCRSCKRHTERELKLR